ncbi:MAG: CDP-diacylglycerol--glycerol-3-phosphate 3-phosphatidyltransferase [Gammaproteobacteria bacterium]
MPINVPNALTSFRILAIPLVVLVFYLPFEWARPASGILFGLAGVTDWLDGYLARRLNQTWDFGAFLDPVADKLMVSTALVLLVQSDPSLLMTMVAIVIIGREITVSALREWMSALGERAQVSVTDFAKWKTTLQIFGISFMLYEYPQFGWPVYGIGMILLLVAVVLTLWSMFDYLRAAWPVMRERT